MRPLDVGVFHPYKYWHDQAVKRALAKLEIDYTICQFLRDLKGIRDDTFKKTTIKHAFKDSGMWPISVEACLKNLKVFTPPLDSEPELPTLPRTPKKSGHVEQATFEWEERIPDQWSSPSKERFRSFLRGTREVAAGSALREQPLAVYEQQRVDRINAKTAPKRWHYQLHPNGLTLEDAQRIEDEIREKAERKQATAQQRNIDKLWREERDREYRKGVIARENERQRKRELKLRQASGVYISPYDVISIPIADTEAIWWSQQPPERQALRARKRGVPKPAVPGPAINNTGDITIITDTQGDLELARDFLQFPDMPDIEDFYCGSGGESSSDDSDDSLLQVGDEIEEDYSSDLSIDNQSSSSEEEDRM
jgi:hypothetical protein